MSVSFNIVSGQNTQVFKHSIYIYCILFNKFIFDTMKKQRKFFEKVDFCSSIGKRNK